MLRPGSEAYPQDDPDKSSHVIFLRRFQVSSFGFVPRTVVPRAKLDCQFDFGSWAHVSVLGLEHNDRVQPDT